MKFSRLTHSRQQNIHPRVIQSFPSLLRKDARQSSPRLPAEGRVSSLLMRIWKRLRGPAHPLPPVEEEPLWKTILGCMLFVGFFYLLWCLTPP